MTIIITPAITLLNKPVRSHIKLKFKDWSRGWEKPNTYDNNRNNILGQSG